MPIPRGESRARLTEADLTGKITINSTCLETEVRHEISHLFASSFGQSDGEILPFVYLRYLFYMKSFTLFDYVQQTHLHDLSNIYKLKDI